MYRSTLFVSLSVFLFGFAFESHAESHAFESDLISVSSRGTGQDVVLIHGFASTSDVWTDLVMQQEASFRFHLVDIKGFAGKKAASAQPEHFLDAIRDEILRYITSEKLDKPILAGHSMGGLLSLMIGSTEPDQIKKIIVVDALPFYSLLFNPMATSEQITPFALNMETQLVNMNEEQFTAQSENSASILTKDPDNVATLIAWSTSSDRNVYAQLIREVMAYDSRDALVRITCPVVILFAFDEAMPITSDRLETLYQTAYTNLEQVELVRVDDSFHFIMWDQSHRFQSIMAAALSSKPETDMD